MARKRLESIDPPAVHADDVLELLQQLTGDTAALQDALVGLTLTESSLERAYGVVVRAAKDSRAQVRATAVLCLGHLARIHGALPGREAVGIVKAALSDENPLVRGQAENAEADFEVFLPEFAAAVREP